MSAHRWCGGVKVKRDDGVSLLHVVVGSCGGDAAVRRTGVIGRSLSSDDMGWVG